MTRISLELYRRGHLPAMGEWFALPLIAERVLARCHACLRIGGPSEGADRMVATARRLGKTVFTDIEQVP